MTDDIPVPAGPFADFDPDDLDGHTIEELSDYLDAGRSPANASIDSSPSCQNALAALERLREIAGALSREDDGPDDRDESWIASILAAINLDARAGSDVPLAIGPAEGSLVMTEGALRALIRSIGDHVAGFLIGRIRFEGDITDFGSPITIALTVSIVEGFAIPESVAALRSTIAVEVARHTALTIAGIDIAVQDLQTIASTDPEADR